MRRLTEGRAKREWVIEEIAPPPGPIVRIWRTGPHLTPREAHATEVLWRKWGINCRAVQRPVEGEP